MRYFYLALTLMIIFIARPVFSGDSKTLLEDINAKIDSKVALVYNIPVHDFPRNHQKELKTVIYNRLAERNVKNIISIGIHKNTITVEITHPGSFQVVNFWTRRSIVEILDKYKLPIK